MSFDIQLALAFSGILALVPLGAGLIWAARALALFRHGYSWGLRALDGLGWLILVGSLLTIAVSLLHVGVLMAAVIFPMILLITWGWKRRGDRLQVLWALGSAARAGLPFSPGLRSLAHERKGWLGVRLIRFADLVDQGVPVPVAAAQSIHRLTFDGDVALHVHWRLQAMSDLFQDQDPDGDETEKILMKLSEIALYSLIMVAAFIGVCGYLGLRVVPDLNALLAGQPRPAPLAWFSAATGWLVSQTGSMALAGMLGLSGLVISGVTTFVFLRHLQMLPRDLPLLSRWGQPLDRARLLAALALALHKQQPLTGMLAYLSENYPKSRWRRRLRQALSGIGRGEDWLTCLRAARLVSAGDLELLRAAERTGSSAWALRELAHAVRRRYLYRLKWWHQLVAPAVVVLWGGAVATLTLVVIMPLAQMIGDFL